MSQTPGEGAESKSRKPRVAKVAKSPKAQDAKSKVKISSYISLESARRLGIHATMTGQDKSQIIDKLINDHLRDWVVQFRPSAKGTEESGPEAEAQAS